MTYYLLLGIPQKAPIPIIDNVINVSLRLWWSSMVHKNQRELV